MGNRTDNQINKNIIVKIVMERLVQKGGKREICNSLIKLGYQKQEAEDIIKESIKELANMGIFLKSGNFINFIIFFLIVMLIIFFYFIFIRKIF